MSILDLEVDRIEVRTPAYAPWLPSMWSLVAIVVLAIVSIVTTRKSGAAGWFFSIPLCVILAAYLERMHQCVANEPSALKAYVGFRYFTIEVGVSLGLIAALGLSGVVRTDTACWSALAYLTGLLCPIIRCNANRQSGYLRYCRRLGLLTRVGVVIALSAALTLDWPMHVDFALPSLGTMDVVVASGAILSISICLVRAFRKGSALSELDPSPIALNTRRSSDLAVIAPVSGAPTVTG